MIITYQGISAIKIQQGDITIALNPISKDGSEKASSFGADTVLVSMDHPDTNGVENATRGDKVPFVIDGPGEYEVKGLIVKGLITKTLYGGENRYHTIYRMVLDDISILYLGLVGSEPMSAEIQEEMDTADIVIVPVGGKGAVGGKDAYKLAMSFEPHVIIPIHTTSGDQKLIAEFMKEAGADKKKPEEKLVIKRKEVLEKDSETIPLAPSN